MDYFKAMDGFDMVAFARNYLPVNIDPAGIRIITPEEYDREYGSD